MARTNPARGPKHLESLLDPAGQLTAPMGLEVDGFGIHFYLLRAEDSVDISMPVKNSHDLDAIPRASIEDHILSAWKASRPRSELVPLPADPGG
jgi:hypothetical protein